MTDTRTLHLPTRASQPLRRSLYAAAFALALTLGALPAMPTHAQNLPAISTDGTLLSISAQAEAKRVPDIATLNTGVVTQAADANTAMRANAEQMDKVMAAIRKAGVAERDVRTSGVNLYPQYHHDDGGRSPTITAYQANNTVSITVRDIGKLGQVMDALVAAGANQVHGPSFDVDDKESAYDEARRTAVEKARGRAEMYAKTLGMKVRRIVSISEGGGGFGPPRPMPMMAMRAESVDTPISPGESTLSVNLDIVFELGN